MLPKVEKHKRNKCTYIIKQWMIHFPINLFHSQAIHLFVSSYTHIASGRTEAVRTILLPSDTIRTSWSKDGRIVWWEMIKHIFILYLVQSKIHIFLFCSRPHIKADFYLDNWEVKMVFRCFDAGRNWEWDTFRIRQLNKGAQVDDFISIW